MNHPKKRSYKKRKTMKIIEIIFTCLAATLGGILTYKWKEIGLLGKVTLIVVIIAALLIAINEYRKNSEEKRVEKINSKYGEIVDEDGATIPVIMIGNTGSDSGAELILGGTGTFNFDPYGPLLKVYVKKNKLYVNTIIRDDKKVIAVIEDNIWTLYDNSYEYNNDNTAFELVTKGERKVFFQIELKNGTARVSGFLINDKGWGLMFHAFDKGGLMEQIRSHEDYLESYGNLGLIKRLFKYPREKFYEKSALFASIVKTIN